ncbi:MAG: SIS domain-containing protein [Acidimicrobiales bacterium]|jgi:fructoselysine-6-P-deglycase FrlB-like protein
MGQIRAEADTLVDEVNSQPSCWVRAGQMAAASGLPDHGSRIALVGCGTSRYMAEAVAAWREAGGFGESDAFAASEMPLERSYDVVVAISRSGTTTEVLRLIEALSPRTEIFAITGAESTPIAKAASRNISLPFADEESVVQTRFATSVLALWRSHLGHDVEHLAELARQKLIAPLPERLGSFEQFVFLGQGAGVGLANEAALKLREASLCWTEAYPSMELRHGPISLLEAHSLVWSLSELPAGLSDDVLASGATLEPPSPDGDPMVELVGAQLAAIALAGMKGIDPSRPRGLSRSIVLA